MNILDRINLKLNYNIIGKDIYGNKYHESKIIINGNKKRVIRYKGISEPTKIPPMWHAWMHYFKQEAPSLEEMQIESWQREYMPNLTGIKKYQNEVKKMDSVSSEYNAWQVTEGEPGDE